MGRGEVLVGGDLYMEFGVEEKSRDTMDNPGHEAENGVAHGVEV